MKVPARWLLVPVLLGLLSSTVFAGAVAERAPISLSDYLGRLTQARSGARAGLITPASAQMLRVRAVLGLPADIHVGPHLVHVEQDPVLERLGGGHAEDFGAALRRIDILAARAEAAAGADPPSPDATRRALDEAYRGIGTARPGLADRIRQAASEALQWLVDSLSHLRGAGTLVAWLIVFLLLLPLVPLARRLQLVPDRASAERHRETGVTDWRRLADEALARGDLREAVRALYAAMLATLAASGVVANSPAVTAGECGWAVTRRQPEVAPAVVAATSAFERVTYGHREPTPADVASLQRADRALAGR